MSNAQALTTTLFQFVWQGALIALALWFVLLLLHKSSASIRYAISCLALTAMIVLPTVTFYRLRPSSFETPTVAAVVSQAETTTVGSNLASLTPTRWMERIQPWALPFWLLGMLLCSIRLFWASQTVYRIRRGAEAVNDAVRASAERMSGRIKASRPVRVLMSAAIDSPSVVGWIRPVILLPAASLAALEPEQLEAILAHEIAHICRYDDILNMVQTVAEIVLFYHPAVWWVSSRIRRERELCCDDMAVGVTGNRVGYARALARLERMRLAPSMALGVADDSLSYRIRRIVGETVPARPQTLTPAIAVLCICLGLALVTATAKPADSEPAQTGTVSAAPPSAPAAPASFANPAVYFLSSTKQGSSSFSSDAAGVAVDAGAATIRRRAGISYPEAALSKGIQGTVTVEVSTDSEARVTDARVLSGPMELRRACLQSVLQWQLSANAANSTRQIAIRFDAASAPANRKQQSDPSTGGMHRIPNPANPDMPGSDKMMEDMQQTLRERSDIEEQMAQLKARLDEKQLQAQIRNMENELRASMQERAAADASGRADLKAQLNDQQVHAMQAQIQELQNQLRRTIEETMQTYANDATRQSIDQALEQSGAAMKQLQAEGILQKMKLNELLLRLRSLAVGGTLTKIEFDGVPENIQSDVLGRMPVKEGDTLSADALDGITAILGSYDPPLDLNIHRNNDDVVLRISKRQF